MLDNNAFDCVDSVCVLYYDNDSVFTVIKLFNFLPDWYPFTEICLPTPLSCYLMGCLQAWICSGTCKKKQSTIYNSFNCVNRNKSGNNKFCFVSSDDVEGNKNNCFPREQIFKILSALSATLLKALIQFLTCNLRKSKLLDIRMSQVHSITLSSCFSLDSRLSPSTIRVWNKLPSLVRFTCNSEAKRQRLLIKGLKKLWKQEASPWQFRLNALLQWFLLQFILTVLFFPKWYIFTEICHSTPLNYYLMKCLRPCIIAFTWKGKNIYLLQCLSIMHSIV